MVDADAVEELRGRPERDGLGLTLAATLATLATAFFANGFSTNKSPRRFPLKVTDLSTVNNPSVNSTAA
jgi:hypothetical protein